MLGDKVVDNERGKVLGMRVLDSEGGPPCMELTFQTTATLIGYPCGNLGTVESRPKGEAMTSRGRGVVVTTEGDAASWTFEGVLHPTGPLPAGIVRGSVFFSTMAPKLMRLNNVCAVVEAEIDADGNMHAELWEWK